jgi:hypothetical protein
MARLFPCEQRNRYYSLPGGLSEGVPVSRLLRRSRSCGAPVLCRSVGLAACGERSRSGSDPVTPRRPAGAGVCSGLAPAPRAPSLVEGVAVAPR